MSVDETTAKGRRRPDAFGASDPDLMRLYLAEIGRTPLLTADEEVDVAKRIEAGLYAADVLRRADAGERELSAADRRDLGVLVREGAHAKERMIRANLRLVVSLAKKQFRSGLPQLDLVQEGNLGLIRAVEKFDYAKGFKFSTYATWWIRQSISRGSAELSRTFRLPLHVVEQLAKFSRVERELAAKLDRDPTPAELSEAVGVPAEKILELRRASREAVSLDSPVGEAGDQRLGDLIEDTDGPTAADLVEQAALSSELRTLVDALPERDAVIISMRYGLADGTPRTLQEVAEHVHLTRERVRQLEKLALAQLRDPQRSGDLLALAG